MKKRQIKALRLLADELPESYELLKITKGVLGAEVPVDIKLSANFEIASNSYYKLTGKEFVKINHLNRLKSAFRRNEEQGLVDYIEWLDRNNKRLNKMFSKENKGKLLDRVSSSVMRIAKGGAKSFWKNLYFFLFAFVKSFIKDEDKQAV